MLLFLVVLLSGLKQFHWDGKDSVVHPPSKRRKCLLRTPELLLLSAGVLGEVLPACRDGTGLLWH